MNEIQQISDVQALTISRYEQVRQRFVKLVEEENRLRREILRLDKMVRDYRQTGDISKIQIVGVDVLWQDWAGRVKQSLNIQLAKVLAVKEKHLSDVQNAHSRVLVIQEMNEELQKKVQIDAERKSQENAIKFSLQEGWTSSI